MISCRPLLLHLMLAFPLAACGQKHGGGALDLSNTKEAWNAVNDPLNLRDQYEVRFSALPQVGELEQKPWTDTYWPSHLGGLADRWNDPASPNSFTYPLRQQAEIAALGVDDLKKLSPAEKYDILVGRYDYPLTSYERQRTHPDDQSWFGLCHGWAPAALNFREPKPVLVAGAAGVQVPFGSSDVKALLLFAQQSGLDSRAAGDRCNSDTDSSSSECRDINAGSFHVILTNQVGLLQQGFVAEVARGSQIWNQPVFGFKTDVLGVSGEVYAGAAPGTVKIVSVRTMMRYIAEMGPRWDPLPFAAYPNQEGDRTYEYKLELNAADEIIGGEWTHDDHPDFVWTQRAPELTGFFNDLRRVYEQATQ